LYFFGNFVFHVGSDMEQPAYICLSDFIRV
jgi:hypothetical protein